MNLNSLHTSHITCNFIIKLLVEVLDTKRNFEVIAKTVFKKEEQTVDLIYLPLRSRGSAVQERLGDVSIYPCGAKSTVFFFKSKFEVTHKAPQRSVCFPFSLVRHEVV